MSRVAVFDAVEDYSIPNFIKLYRMTMQNSKCQVTLNGPLSFIISTKEVLCRVGYWLFSIVLGKAIKKIRVKLCGTITNKIIKIQVVK